MSSRGRRRLLLGVALGSAALAYAPIVRNFFHTDDWLNLQAIANDSFAHYVFQPWSGHVLIVRNALFWAFFGLFGTRTEVWFLIVLLTHLANVALLFAVVRQLTGSGRLACFGATLWGVAPANEGALGWYAVYGQVVAATFVLLVLLRLARRSDVPGPVPVREVLAWCALITGAATTFGVGIGVALALPPAVLVLLPGPRLPSSARALLVAFPIVVLGAYAVLHAAYGRAYGEPQDGVLVLVRALARWPDVAGMLVHLLGAGSTALLGGFALPLAHYPGPAPYALAGLFVAAFVAALVGAPPPARRLLLALGLVVLGNYTIVAAGRGALFGATPNVAAYGAASPRFHYLGPALLAILLCVILARLAGALPERPGWRDALLAAWLSALMVSYVRSDWRIDHFESDRVQTAAVVDAIQDAIDRTPPGLPVYVENRPFPPAFLRAPYFAGWASVFTIYFRDDPDRPVYFLEPSEAVRRVGRPGSRLAAALIPSRPAGAGTHPDPPG